MFLVLGGFSLGGDVGGLMIFREYKEGEEPSRKMHHGHGKCISLGFPYGCPGRL